MEKYTHLPQASSSRPLTAASENHPSYVADNNPDKATKAATTTSAGPGSQTGGPMAVQMKALAHKSAHSPKAVQLKAMQHKAATGPKAMQFKAMQDLAANSPVQSPLAQLQKTGANQPSPAQKMESPASKQNKTGMPDSLKTGIENLSGHSLDDVKVHYNSPKPAQLQAHAYAQGTDIHVASGQEKYLPHEAWHVVQQKQGRVQPTTQMAQGVNVNDDVKLEREADIMGGKALQSDAATASSPLQAKTDAGATAVQRQAVIQKGSDPIDESKGIPFKFGLVKGTYVPATNEADMHVEKKSDDTAFSPVDAYRAFTFVYGKMEAQKKKSGREGKLSWNPQGAAVIKMVVELIGKSLGSEEGVEAAKLLQQNRKLGPRPVQPRDENVISQDIIPEHMRFLSSARGAEGVDMQAVIPGKDTEQNFDSNILADTQAGRERYGNYQDALLEDLPVSLRITIGQTQLKSLIDTMKG
ncbi:DUF4157 domain-containing protein [Roseivirga sp. BDSF3-8]|uniref:eCIS core domain-containing protein n=1 Tax=Roseivirga sp. BDSF3-8 TaxID=3241598 RepID=UPI0035321E81